MKPLFQWLAPAGPHALLSTLIFHRVLPQPDPLFPSEVDARSFDALCGWLRTWFNVLPLAQALQMLGAGQLPARPLAITFDDGYADNCTVALPILQRHGLNATFFISTGFLDGGIMWNDRVIESIRCVSQPVLDLRNAAGLDLGLHPLGSVAERRQAIASLLRRIKHLPPAQRDAAVAAVAAAARAELPRDLMLTTPQLLALRDAGMGLGAHTINHPILAKLDRAAAEREIVGGRDQLQALIGQRVGLFAYPNGKPGDDFTDVHAELARRAGFDAAVTTAWGVANARSDPFRTPRFTPWDRTRVRFGLRMVGNLRRQR
jgi:peptidoglycan/xylan/chitin deacetylase (PgdA/CDA1 family)